MLLRPVGVAISVSVKCDVQQAIVWVGVGTSAGLASLWLALFILSVLTQSFLPSY